MRAFATPPANVAVGPAEEQPAWDSINNDLLADYTFDRTVLNGVYLVFPPPVANTDTYRPCYTLDALRALVTRRCLPLPANLATATRVELIDAYLAYARFQTFRLAQEKAADLRTRRNAAQFKLMQGLRRALVCKRSYVSASRFVQEVTDYQVLYNIDATVMFGHLTTPERLDLGIHAAWRSSDATAHPRTFDGFRRWLYREYVQEQMIMELRTELFGLRQGNARLRDFMSDVVAKYHQFAAEFTLAGTHLAAVSTRDVTDVDLYIHLRRNAFHSTDLTQMLTLSGVTVTNWATLQQAAVAVAAKFQPAEKKGMEIRGVVQRDNKHRLSTSATTDPRFAQPPNKRQKLQPPTANVLLMTEEERFDYADHLRQELFQVENAEQTFSGRNRNSNSNSNRGRNYNRNRNRGNAQRKQGFRGNCFGCGQFGHTQRECKTTQSQNRRGRGRGRGSVRGRGSYGRQRNRFRGNNSQQQRSGAQRKPTGNYKCYNCGSREHFIRDCPKPKDVQRSRNSAAAPRSSRTALVIDSVADRRVNAIFGGPHCLVADTFRRHEQVLFREYGPTDRTVEMKMEHFDVQTVYLDGGSTVDIIDRRLAATVMHLAQRCQKFGVNTAGGLVTCNKFIPLQVFTQSTTYVIRWYVLEELDLPHRWILSRGTLEKLGWTDILVRLDDLNNDTEFTNYHHAVIGYEGDAGPWTDKSYPLQGPRSNGNGNGNSQSARVEQTALQPRKRGTALLTQPEKELFGPECAQMDGLVSRERVKLGEFEARDETYELYMTCLNHESCDKPAFGSKFEARHGDLHSAATDASVLRPEAPSKASRGKGKLRELLTADVDAGTVRCGDISDPAIREKFAQLVASLPQAKSRTDIGCLPEEFEITLKTGALPCYTPQYSSAHKWTDEIRQQCIELMKAGFIHRSKSQYQSAILFVAKPDGTWRMCFDYRKLNEQTVPDNYNLPNMNDLFTKFRGNRFFSSIDMRSAYHNVPIAKKDQHKTAFITPWGLFEWSRLTFGFRNAPAHFQRSMDRIFQAYPFVLVYLDDIFVMSRTEEEHLEHLRAIAAELEKYNLKTRLSKCSFFAAELQYLGHVVTRDGFHPNQRYVDRVLRMSRPTSRKEVARYLGMVTWLSKFIPNLAQAQLPISRLRGEQVTFRWTDECDVAFDRMQEMVANAKLLHHPNFDKPFWVQTDASNDCVGAFLFQRTDDATVLPIEFMSRKLTGNELNWHSNEKECFAVLTAVKKWYKFLVAQPFTVLTDHKNLQVLLASTGKIASGRVLRWAVYLKAECRFTVRYIKGEDNVPADFLSRDILKGALLRENRKNALVFMLSAEQQYLEAARASHAARNSRSQGALGALSAPDMRAQHTGPAPASVPRPSFDVNDHVDEEKEDEEEEEANGGMAVDISVPAVPPSVPHPFAVSQPVVSQRVVHIQEQWDEILADEPWEGVEMDDQTRPLRFEDPECETLLDSTNWEFYLTPALIRVYQRADPLLGVLHKVLSGDRTQSKFLAHCWRKRIRKGLVFLNERGIVMTNNDKIMVPEQLQPRILDYFHATNYFAHQGRDRMVAHIGARFYWVNLHRDVTRHISECDSCRQVKGAHHVKRTLLQLFPSRYPFHMVACDLVELPHARTGEKHLLTMIDRFSRYAVAVPLKDSTTSTVVSAIVTHWIYKHGVPDHLLTDNGPQFTSRVWKQFVQAYCFTHKKSTPYHPQSNGMIERLHRYLKQRLVLAALDKNMDLLSGDDWSALVAPAIFAYNSTVNRMTGHSPFELIFNRSPRFPIDLALNLRANDVQCTGDVREYRQKLAAHQRAIFSQANATQAGYDERRKASYDRNRQESTLEEGEHVTLYAGDGKVGKKRKFTQKWKGIWRLEERKGNSARVRELSTGAEKTVHLSKLKRIRWFTDQTL